MGALNHATLISKVRWMLDLLERRRATPGLLQSHAAYILAFDAELQQVPAVILGWALEDPQTGRVRGPAAPQDYWPTEADAAGQARDGEVAREVLDLGAVP